MLRISSDWTLFYKFFVPTVWMTFFGVATGILVFSLKPGLPIIAGALLFYAIGIAFLYFTLMSLKRVEGTDAHLYVTNYSSTFRYTFDSLSKITSLDVIIFKVIFLHFNAPTSYGRKIFFIRRRVIWDEYLSEHEALARICVV